jgi:hypothetical protein
MLEKRSKDIVVKRIDLAMNDRKIKIEGLESHIENSKEAIEVDLPHLLARGKMTQEEYDEQINQTQQDLQTISKGCANLVQSVERLNKIKDSGDEIDCFVIPDTTSKNDVKKLAELLKVQLTQTKDKEERAFLSAILETTDAYKTHLVEGREPETIMIPLLQSETKYVASLLEQMKHYELNKPKSEMIENYLKKIEKFDTFKDQATFDPKMSESEKRILHSLCDNINNESKVVLKDLISPGAEVDEEKFKEQVAAHIESSMEQARNIPITSGFKGIINDICEFFELKPVFTVSSNNLIEQMKSIKDSLQLIKDDDPGLEDADESQSLLRNL